MATIVLVHGSWHGGWCWKRVRARLQQAGHAVFTPTLTGLCESVHLASPSNDLQTHIDDVVNLLRWEELEDVILCGHSYAGLVITGVAEAVPERIRSLVYLDAFLAEDGQSLHDALPPDIAELQRTLAREHGDGWQVPPIPAALFHVNEADRDWVDRQCTSQSIACFQQPLRFSEKATSIADIRYIVATGWPDSPFGHFAEIARGRGWRVQSIESGHDVMLDHPAELTELLVAA